MTPAVQRGSVIPIGAWVVAALAFLLAFMGLAISVSGRHATRPEHFVMLILVPAALAGYILLIGYVYGDAQRRGMRYVMWTLLSIFLLNGIGIILYFILREPLLGFCSKCGSPANNKFAFCPHCGSGLQPSCPSCHRVIQGPWAHCAWCGTKM